MQELSDLMKVGMKEGQHPMDRAIWWLEYLSVTKGANHLKLSSRHLNVIQYFSLDFILMIFIIFCLSFRLGKIMYNSDIVHVLQFCFNFIAFSGQLIFLYFAYYLFLFCKYFCILFGKIPICKTFRKIFQVQILSLLCKAQNSGFIQQWRQYNIAFAAYWVLIIAILLHYTIAFSSYF